MLSSYLKIAWKVLARRPFFTAASLFGIAFTMLVLLVAAALVDQVFAPLPPETRGGRTLGIYSAKMWGPSFSRTGGAGWGLVDRYARDLPGVERMSAVRMQRSAVTYLDGRRLRYYLKRADAQFWRILDFDFVEGGPYSAEDDAARRRVAVINESTRRHFFGDAAALGRQFEIDGQPYRVVGVVRDVPFLRVVPFADVWTPLGAIAGNEHRNELVGDFIALLLLADGADPAAVKSELAARLDAAQLPDPKTFDSIAAVPETLFEAVSRVMGDAQHSRPGMLAGLLAAAGLLFMLLPAVNLININLSRIMERAAEIGVRKAFGASVRHLVAQFLVENVVLTLCGAALGLAGAALALAGIEASGVIPYAQLPISWRVFACGLGLALFFGILSGVYPAWRMSRLAPATALRGRSL